ncbi:MAG: family hydrolase [Solirubrobacterales bacterium]|nr:family hydrolase [Solirubrobacterales bacterium]
MTGAVLFDLDGTLVDSRAPVASCINDALVAHGLAPRDPAELHAFIGPPLHATFVLLAGADLADRCVARFREVYRVRAPLETPVFAGVAELLGALAGRPLAIATSKPQEVTDPLIDALGLRGHFAAVVGPPLHRDDTKAQTIAQALRALGVSEGAMVGDRSFDMLGAKANGLRAIGALWGIGDEAELRAAGADALAATPADVLALLP